MTASSFTTLTRFSLVCLFGSLFVTLPLPGSAERADRDKPILVEANQIKIDDARKVQVLEGNVVMTKGTLRISADRIVMTEDEYGFQRGVAYGSPGRLARYKQKQDDSDAWSEGEAVRIEYDTRSEIAQLFKRAQLKSGGSEVRGNYIWYDSITGKFAAKGKKTAQADSDKPQEGAPTTKKTGDTDGEGRVQAIIQPRNRQQASDNK